MNLLFFSILYIFTFIIHGTRALVSNSYDWDVDQFMYSGSRLINGELAWTREYDEKLPVVQYLFALPAALKSTAVWVVFTTIVSLLACYLTYRLIINLLVSYKLSIDKRKINSISLFCISFYLCLLVCIHGSIIHINAICSSINLIIICLLYLDGERVNQNKLISFYFIGASLLASLIISIRPYLLLPLVFTGMWMPLRLLASNRFETRLKFFKYSFSYLAKWILFIISFGIILNLTPYILTDNIYYFIKTIQLNILDSVEPQNALFRQYVNIGKNPILYPSVIVFILIPFLRYKLHKKLSGTYLNVKNKINFKANFIDIDILFFCITCPLLLEYSFINRHFFSHYFNLFSPYICISLSIFISLVLKLDNYNQFPKKRLYFRNMLVSTVLIVCLLTDKSILNSFDRIVNGDGLSKLTRLEHIDDFLQKNNANGNNTFLFPEDNFYHWKLAEPRHGFPQAAVYKRIRLGMFDHFIEGNKDIKHPYLLPKKDELCDTLINSGPDLIFTESNDFAYRCFQEKETRYKLMKQQKNLSDLDIYVFKKR